MNTQQVTFELLVKIVENFNEVNNKIDRFSDSQNKASASGLKLKDTMANLGLRLQGISSLFQMISSSVKNLIDSFNAQEIASSKLANGLKNVGEGSESLAKLTAQAEQLQSTTAFSDDQIMNAQSMLTTFQKSSEEISILTPRILDLASAYAKSGDSGMDLQQVAVMLGKVNEETVGQLRRVGVAFSKEQEEKLKSLEGTEQAIYLSQILDQNFKGMAETVGNTAAGKMKIFQNKVDDLKESFGKILVTALVPFLTTVGNFLDEINKADPAVKKLALGVSALGIVFVVFNTQLGVLPYVLTGIFALISAMPNALKIVSAALTVFSAAVIAVNMKLQFFTATLGGWPMVIGLVVTAVAALALSFNDFNDSIEELNSSIENSNSKIGDYSLKIDQTKNNLANLTLALKFASGEIKVTEQTQASYNRTLDNLRTVFPYVYNALNSQSKSQEEVTVEIEKTIKQQESLLKLYSDARVAEHQKKINEQIKLYDSEIDKLEDLRKKKQLLDEDMARGYKYGREGNIYPITQSDKDDLVEYNSMISDLEIKLAPLAVEFANAFQEGHRFGTLEKDFANLVSSSKNNLTMQEALVRALKDLGVQGDFTFSSLIQNTNSYADALKNALNIMNQVSSSVLSPGYDPSLDTKKKEISDLTKELQEIPESQYKSRESEIKHKSNYIKQLNKEIEDIEISLGLKERESKSGRSSRQTSIADTVDAADELLNNLRQQLEIYKAEESIKAKLQQSGLSELDIISKLNNEILNNSYNTEQILKLYQYRSSLADDLLQQQEEFNRAEEEEMDFNLEFFRTLEDLRINLIKNSYEKERKSAENEYDEKLDELNSLYTTEEQYKEKLYLLQETRDEKLRQVNLKYKQESLSLDLQSADLIENAYLASAERIKLEYEQAMLIAGEEGDENLKTRKEDLAKRKRDKDLGDLQKQLKREIIDTITNGLSSGLSIIQQMGSLLGLAADSFISKLLNGLQQAISLASSILNFISAVSSAFSGGGLFSAIGLFASGGYVPGSGSGDTVPALLTPGEFVIRKSRVESLASQYGSGFLSWLNGGSLLAQNTGHFASGGLVPASPSPQTIHIIAEDKISGENIYKIWHVVDSKRSRWSSS